MSLETFRRLYRQPGFKYEYVDGKARISVQESASAVVVARPALVLDRVEERAFPERVILQPAEEADPEALVAAWVDAFTCAPDYHRYSIRAIQKDVKSNVDRLFSAEDRGLHPASAVATHGSSLVGALLVSTRTARPSIAGVFVRRDMRRRGVGAALARQRVAWLRDQAEELEARFHKNPDSASPHL